MNLPFVNAVITPSNPVLASHNDSVTVVFRMDTCDPSVVEKISVAGFYATAGLVLLLNNHRNQFQHHSMIHCTPAHEIPHENSRLKTSYILKIDEKEVSTES